ncbi:MAG: ABC transporter substrate-binding protein, partial [Nitrospirota bacterium]|nr:ABC transporter substrate-binding protein [Nitrospirota bacterium]
MSPIFRSSIIVLHAILLASLLVGCGKKEAPQPATEVDKVVQPSAGTLPPRDMKIGVLGPETGELAEYGRKTLVAAQIAVDEINDKGGISGKKL